MILDDVLQVWCTYMIYAWQVFPISFPLSIGMLVECLVFLPCPGVRHIRALCLVALMHSPSSLGAFCDRNWSLPFFLFVVFLFFCLLCYTLFSISPHSLVFSPLPVSFVFISYVLHFLLPCATGFFRLLLEVGHQWVWMIGHHQLFSNYI